MCKNLGLVCQQIFGNWDEVYIEKLIQVLNMLVVDTIYNL